MHVHTRFCRSAPTDSSGLCACTSSGTPLAHLSAIRRLHVRAITRLLKATHYGEIPVVRYDPFHSKAEHLGAEWYLFQWNGRHVRKAIVNGLIWFVLDGIEVVWSERHCDRLAEATAR